MDFRYKAEAVLGALSIARSLELPLSHLHNLSQLIDDEQLHDAWHFRAHL